MPVCHPARLHVGQPGVGERLGLEVDVAEPAGPVEGQLGGAPAARRDRRRRSPCAATATQPCSRHGGWSSSSRRARANQARLAVRLPSPLANTSPSRTHAIAARRRSSAAVKPRMAADRWATTASMSPRPSAASAESSARSAPSMPGIAPGSYRCAQGGSPHRCASRKAADRDDAPSSRSMRETPDGMIGVRSRRRRPRR